MSMSQELEKDAGCEMNEKKKKKCQVKSGYIPPAL